MNILTKFQKDWIKTVTSTVYTNKLLTDARTHIRTMDITQSHKLTMSLRDSSHETNVLSKFHENWAKNVTSSVFTCFHFIHIEKNAPPTGGHVFSPIPTIFKLVRDINKSNVLTNFHDDWAKIVTSRMFTRENCHYIHLEKNAPPTAAMKTAPPTGYVFQRIGTTFELNQDIIKTNFLTKLHEDWA
ncbi:hypothetical protein DPMN_130944 [Dreissena polymorpha]|uniref:Uncharacterized protein n=1 Tax=Dreissena polymorpha TaxID=45954 RepID=A0A9D4H8K6_DREPO|nr:hypothetical protein DPMN_130944 [Dreissena polymorpha]